MVEMPSGARASMTGPRADPEVHRDAAITCPQRLYATGINASSGPEQPEAVGKAPRDSAYPSTRTGPKGASRADLPAVARRREARAGLLGVRVVKFSFSAFQNTIDRTLGPRWRPSVAGRAVVLARFFVGPSKLRDDDKCPSV